MIDNQGRDIHYLRISVTDFCNLRCRYCMPADGVAKKNHADILRVEEIERIARAAAGLGIDKIRITGGEPLVRRGIVEICRRIGRIPQIKDLCLTTNGILLGDLAQPIKDAGVNRVNISLDTLNAEKYKEITRVGDIGDVFTGMEAAKKAGLWPIKLNVVLIGGFNDDEIADFVNLTRSEDIEVRFIELMPIGQTAYWEKGNFIAGQEVLNRVPGLVPLLQPEGTACLYKLPGARGNVGLISPINRHFCATCNRVRVTADGKLKVCLHSDEEINLKGATDAELENILRQGILGKPMGHHLAERPSDSHRDMNQIGG